MTLVLLLLVNKLAACWMWLSPKQSVYVDSEGRDMRIEGMGGPAWGAQLLREQQVAIWSLQREPYTDFSLKQPPGLKPKYVGLDEEGHRITWNPPAKPGANPLRVFVFGGSTVWGMGNRNEHTIPSILSRQLAEAGIDAQVTSRGMIAYVSTQGVIRLIRMLGGDAAPPDVVIFFDGLNDVQSVLMTGEAGLTFFEGYFQQTFGILDDNGRLLGQAFRNTSLMKLLEPDDSPTVPPLPEEDVARLAQDITRRYVANVRTVEGLATRYQFIPLCYWQPTIFHKPTLSPFEDRAFKSNWPEATPRLNKALFLRTTGEVKRALADAPSFRDMSDVFSTRSDTVYTDFAHYSEAANEIIVRKIVADIVEARRTKAAMPGASAPAPGP